MSGEDPRASDSMGQAAGVWEWVEAEVGKLGGSMGGGETRGNLSSSGANEGSITQSSLALLPLIPMSIRVQGP